MNAVRHDHESEIKIQNKSKNDKLLKPLVIY